MISYVFLNKIRMFYLFQLLTIGYFSTITMTVTINRWVYNSYEDLLCPNISYNIVIDDTMCILYRYILIISHKIPEIITVSICILPI